MANLLTLVRPFVYETMQELLVVQTGAIAKTVEVARTLRKHFPDAHIHGVVRDDDAAAVDAGAFDRLTAVRWEDRVAVVRELRAVRYDAVADAARRPGQPRLSRCCRTSCGRRTSCSSTTASTISRSSGRACVRSAIT